MEIADLSWNEVISKRFNNPLLPRSIRGLIVGKSGCGKTTLLLNLLLRPGWLDYDNLCVFGKSLFQPKYQILKKAFEENFFPKVSTGHKIIETPRNRVYLPITLDSIDRLTVSITDQDDHLLILRNEKLTIRFHIRES